MVPFLNIHQCHEWRHYLKARLELQVLILKRYEERWLVPDATFRNNIWLGSLKALFKLVLEAGDIVDNKALQANWKISNSSSLSL